MDEKDWQQYLASAREAGDRVREGEYLAGLGSYYANTGRYSEAIETLSAAIRQLQDAGAPQLAPSACKNLASVYEMVYHDLPTAARYIQMGADMASPQDSRKEEYGKWAADLRERAKRGG